MSQGCPRVVLTALACALGALGLLACGEPSAPESSDGERRAEVSASVGGAVVSTVQGRPITRAQVEAAARAARVSPRLALRRLQEERLLAYAAERHGVAADAELAVAVRQAAVQRLLHEEVEASVTLAAVDEARVTNRFESELARFETAEQRSSTHLVALVPADAAPALVEAAREYVARQLEAAAGPDPASALLAVTRRLDGIAAFDVQAEEVLAMTRDSQADPAYVAAVFGAEAEGLLPTPVRSALGWHAIAITEIQPAVEISREEALETIRAEELARLRAARLEALVGELARERGVTVDSGRAHALFSNPAFLAEAP